MMKVFIGADHRGFQLKEVLKAWLSQKGYSVTDCGNTVYEKADDFTDFAFAVADIVAKDAESRGILLCGSSGGVVIAANKVRGIRAVTAVTVADVHHNRDHNNANVLAVAGDFADENDAKQMVEVFLTTPYLGEERMVRRLKRISDREAQ